MKPKTNSEASDIDNNKVWTVKDSAKYLGISERQMWREIHDRRIEAIALGRRRRGITQGALLDFIKERTVPKFNPNDAVKNMLAG